MAQSLSSKADDFMVETPGTKKEGEKPKIEKVETEIPLPKRGFSLEFLIGLFAIAGVAAAAYLSVGLGGLEMNAGNKYTLFAEFDNIAGLKYGASVEIAGVPVGEVSEIILNDSVAKVALKIDRSVKLHDDDIISIRTKGIIGDRYVKISRGSSEKYLEEGMVIKDNTESVVDFEDVIGKIVHRLGGDE